MATIQQRCGNWRAIVRVKGYSATRTFRSKAEAASWGALKDMEFCARYDQLVKYGSRQNRSLLPVNRLLAEAIPNLHSTGVYFLIKQGVVVYVGKSSNVGSRIVEHASKGREFDSFNVHFCLPEELTNLEAAYIAALKPIGNKTREAK